MKLCWPLYMHYIRVMLECTKVFKGKDEALGFDLQNVL